MKHMRMKSILAVLCMVALLVTSVLPVVADLGGEFPWRKTETAVEKILHRDGMIDGVWYPWINGGSSGHNLTGNDLMAKYYGDEWARVELDYHGADEVYREIYNLKAMGYNMMAWAGSIYGEGVIYDDNGDVLGIKQDYLANARRLLNICREVGMPVMWNVYFHNSSAGSYYLPEVWDKLTQMPGNRIVADHYAQRYVKPLCRMLAEYPDVVVMVSIADEPENEVNDVEIGDHFGDTGRSHYGVNRDDMLYFLKGINNVVKKELPNVARTIAANKSNKEIFNDFNLDLMGHNRYDNNANVPTTESYKSNRNIILTEYNVGGDVKLDEKTFLQRQITFRENMIKNDYKGGFSWCWMPYKTKNETAYYLLDSTRDNTDFREAVAGLRHYIDDYRAEYQGKEVALDPAVLYANDGTGLVEWIPSPDATKMDIQRSDDGGKTWKTILTDKDQADYVTKGKGMYEDKNAPRSGYCYRIVVRDGKGHEATSTANNVAGVENKFVKSDYTTDIEVGTLGQIASNKAKSPGRLLSFSVETNRPASASDNAIKNSSFEANEGQWTSVLGDTLSVVTDKTAPVGKKTLYYNTSADSTAKWYKFKVAVKPDTNYVFSTWIKGAYLSDSNAGTASVGVMDPAYPNNYMVYWEFYRDRQRGSGDTWQVYPTAYDNEWHLRAVSFKTGADETEVEIGFYGKGTKIWLDDMALFPMDSAVKYTGVNMSSSIHTVNEVDIPTCLANKSLTENIRLDDVNDTYWQTGTGWDNGFMSVYTGTDKYRRSLKYTATKEHPGTYYIKWVPVQPNTDYIFSVDMKVLKDGAGKLALLDDRNTLPQDLIALEFDKDHYGSNWANYSIKFNSKGFTRLGIAVCDMGGSALIDNIRLFNAKDAVKVDDAKSGVGKGEYVVLPDGSETYLPDDYDGDFTEDFGEYDEDTNLDDTLNEIDKNKGKDPKKTGLHPTTIPGLIIGAGAVVGLALLGVIIGIIIAIVRAAKAKKEAKKIAG